MTWRTVYISSQCHLSFKNNYLIVRGDEVKMIHMSELNTLIIDNNASSISTYLLNELIKNKVKVMVCDEKHNPSFELIPYHTAYNSSKVIMDQISWDQAAIQETWKQIIIAKIKYQARVLQKYGFEEWEKLQAYTADILPGDPTNREGFAAKVYFNRLFGNDFYRDDDEETANAFLNYGYIVLLSMFNREIVNAGYLTQIGIHHIGITNPFNLSCDLMEPFRPVVDQFAYDHRALDLNKDTKIELIGYMNKKVQYDGESVFLSQAVREYVGHILSNLSRKSVEQKWFVYGEE